jgi:hypothetical protein
LDFLKQQGWHTHVVKYQQDDTPSVEKTFLQAPSANYISAWASIYPNNFERSSEAAGILEKLSQTISKASPEDFHILASVPRASLVPQRAMGFAWDESPILSLSAGSPNPDSLKTLATIFHGPIEVSVSHLLISSFINSKLTSLIAGSRLPNTTGLHEQSDRPDLSRPT